MPLSTIADNTHGGIGNSTVSTSQELKFFYGEGCTFTKRVQPAISCLELKLGKEIKKLEIYNNTENRKKYIQAEGPQNCGGVPYFYNETTGSSVCGACSCAVLLEWALAKETFKK